MKEETTWPEIMPGDVLVQDLVMEPDGTVIKPRLVLSIVGSLVTLLHDSRIVSFDHAQRVGTIKRLALHQKRRMSHRSVF
jgi:hypothetical protein